MRGGEKPAESGQPTQVIRWMTHREMKQERSTLGRSPSYRDPTADAAIGNIMREEKRRKQSLAGKGAGYGKH